MSEILTLQPGDKINSDYYCDKVFEQGLLPAIHWFIEWWLTVSALPAHCSHNMVALYLTPMYHSSLKWKIGHETVQI